MLTKAALFHDVGNLVKYDFGIIPIENVDFWKQKQQEIKRKYGADDHEATKKMLAEIGVTAEISKIILDKSFGRAVEISWSETWEVKTLLYADNRVLPHGIGSLEDRLADVRVRYSKYASRPDLEEACREIERQIGENMDVPVAEITEENLTNYNNKDFLGREV